MSDKFDTLHPKGDPSVNIYPNIKAENIPDSSVGKGKLSFSAQTQLYFHAIQFGATDTNGDYFEISLTLIDEKSNTFTASSLLAEIIERSASNVFISVTGLDTSNKDYSHLPIGVRGSGENIAIKLASQSMVTATINAVYSNVIAL